jgi:hypothetical protein
MPIKITKQITRFPKEVYAWRTFFKDLKQKKEENLNYGFFPFPISFGAHKKRKLYE